MFRLLSEALYQINSYAQFRGHSPKIGAERCFHDFTADILPLFTKKLQNLAFG